MKILILGGFGFIGSHLVETLKELGYDVIRASRRNGVDLFDYSLTKKCFIDTKPDIIINCAANVGSVNYVSTYPADIIFSNLQMTLNLYRAAEKICPNVKIINPLSNCSYPGDSEIQEESEWLTDEVHESVYSYGNSKRIIYIISKCYKRQIGIETVNFIVPNTFGPGDSLDPNKTHALNGMILRMIKAKNNDDQKFEIWGSGNPIREWAYVKDVVDILIQGIQKDSELIYPVNLAQNKGYSIKESAQLIKNAVGFKGQLYFNLEYQDGAPTKILSDKLFRQVFPGFEFYNHIKGLKETVNYYKTAIEKENNYIGK